MPEYKIERLLFEKFDTSFCPFSGKFIIENGKKKTENCLCFKREKKNLTKNDLYSQF